MNLKKLVLFLVVLLNLESCKPKEQNSDTKKIVFRDKNFVSNDKYDVDSICENYSEKDLEIGGDYYRDSLYDYLIELYTARILAVKHGNFSDLNSLGNANNDAYLDSKAREEFLERTCKTPVAAQTLQRFTSIFKEEGYRPAYIRNKKSIASTIRKFNSLDNYSYYWPGIIIPKYNSCRQDDSTVRDQILALEKIGDNASFRRKALSDSIVNRLENGLNKLCQFESQVENFIPYISKQEEESKGIMKSHDAIFTSFLVNKKNLVDGKMKKSYCAAIKDKNRSKRNQKIVQTASLIGVPLAANLASDVSLQSCLHTGAALSAVGAVASALAYELNRSALVFELEAYKEVQKEIGSSTVCISALEKDIDDLNKMFFDILWFELFAIVVPCMPKSVGLLYLGGLIGLEFYLANEGGTREYVFKIGKDVVKFSPQIIGKVVSYVNEAILKIIEEISNVLPLSEEFRNRHIKKLKKAMKERNEGFENGILPGNP